MTLIKHLEKMKCSFSDMSKLNTCPDPLVTQSSVNKGIKYKYINNQGLLLSYCKYFSTAFKAEGHKASNSNGTLWREKKKNPSKNKTDSAFCQKKSIMV